MCLSAVLLYQATNAALYYLIATVVYFVAYSEGEVSVDFSLEGFCKHGSLLLTVNRRSSVQYPGHYPNDRIEDRGLRRFEWSLVA